MMQNENSSSVDCAQALDKLFDMLDGELTPEVEAKIHAHVSGCSHCFARADFEKRFLDAVHSARVAEGQGVTGAASDKLRARVFDALRVEGLTDGGGMA
jgi:anti-sigma factor (TIGR02949 family)